ncbi:hypothetical protein [Actinoallomurus sp. CA-150999]|uniref:hypothetical protein n=1 Tax=Actinoallomurus sp. CA-150999 TaxID=3239887 RepID=UPI003D934738
MKFGKKFVRTGLLAGMTLTAASAVAFTAPATAAQASTHPKPARISPAGTVEGCPSGDVCIYPDASWNAGKPSYYYYDYGYYNLSNMYGMLRIFNNQTGGATMRTCTGYNGTGCQGYLKAGTYMDKDMTPINSITLEP